MDPENDPLVDTLQESIVEIIQAIGTPSPQETQDLRDKLAGPEMTLQAIRAEISQLKERLKLLIKKEQQLSQTLNPDQAVFSPFRHLPDDILREIFLACLPTKHNPLIRATEVPTLLTHISRHTRRVALSTPRLWAAIHVPILGIKQWMEKRNAIVSEWLLNRSGTCDLAISLYEDPGVIFSHDYAEDTFKAIIASSERWRNISLTCSFSSFRRFFPVLHNPSNFPRLESFSFKITHKLTYGGNPTHVYDSGALTRSLHLKDVRLYSWSSFGNYKTYKVHWDGLAHLSLGSATNPICMGCVVEIMLCVAQLRTCKLHFGGPEDPFTNLTPLSLPFLTGISLAFDSDWWDSWEAMYFFQEMSLPALEEITYDGSRAFMPLLGLLHGAKGRITHLCVAHLSGPLQLIECLRRCPRLVALDLRSLGRALKDPDSENDQLYPWYSYIEELGTLYIGEYLFPAFIAPGTGPDPEEPFLPEPLCPKLEHLSIRDPEKLVGSAELRAFIAAKFSSLSLSPHTRYNVLKGLCLDVKRVRGDDAKLDRDAFADEISAGLKLSLTYTMPDYMPDHPVDAGIVIDFDAGRPSWWPGGEE